MGCNCSVGDSHQPEYSKPFKPQNNSGCGCGKGDNSCKTPSTAAIDSPLYNWEQIYGKLIEQITVELDESGRFVQVVEKIPCGPPASGERSVRCCSFRYKVTR